MEDLPVEGYGNNFERFIQINGIKIPPEVISLEKVEEVLMREALRMTNGNQTKAAKLLDISRDALSYFM